MRRTRNPKTMCRVPTLRASSGRTSLPWPSLFSSMRRIIRRHSYHPFRERSRRFTLCELVNQRVQVSFEEL